MSRMLHRYGYIKIICRAIVLGLSLCGFITFVMIVSNRDVISRLSAPALNEMVHSSHCHGNDETTRNTSQGVKKVLLYTYMRGGSSILGEIFHRNKDAMYWFEPLDGFYQSSFVLRPMIKPLEIHYYYRNMSKRVVTEHEAEAIADFHYRLFHCNYSHPCLAGLLTDSHNHKSSMGFKDCGMTDSKLIACQNILKQQCITPGSDNYPKGWKTADLENSMKGNCFEKVRNLEKGGLYKTAVSGDDPFADYLKCQDELISLFERDCERKDPIGMCKSKKMQVLKEIRMTMELVEASMVKIPDLVLLYYHRDPRAVLSSRVGNATTDGPGGMLTFKIHDEARVLCHRMALDLKVVSMLRDKYPGRILQLSFEAFASEPVLQASNIYKFIGEELPAYVMDWLKMATNSSGTKDMGKFGTTREDSSKIIDSWREKLHSDLIKNLTDICLDVLLTLNYKL